MLTRAQTMASLGPRTWTLLVWWLHLASFFTFFASAFVAVGMAYLARRSLIGTPFHSHMTSAIRVFWWCLCGYSVGVALFIFYIGVPIIGFVALCQLLAVCRGLFRAFRGQPM